MSNDHQQRNILAQADGAKAKKKKYDGKNYLVVPVIAMVQGVRFGANQDDAELGLAVDFGKLPATWDFRPLVINHPKIKGNFVSANLKEVREEWAFGFTSNAAVKNKKLHMEAWIDLEIAEELDEVKVFVEKIEDGDMIEVSVGFYSDVEEAEGTYQGDDYTGIWRNVIPDHLAFLTESTGACSIEDGCGVPRLNSKTEADMPKNLKADVSNSSCKCGGECDTCSKEVHAQELAIAEKIPTTTVAMSVRAQEVATDITDESIRTILYSALKKYYVDFRVDSWYNCYVVHYTVGESSAVFFSVYVEGVGYVSKAMEFDLSSEGQVTFKGDPYDAVVLSKIVKTDPLKVEETKMSDKKVEAVVAAVPAVQAAAPVTAPVTVAVAPVAVVQAAPVVLSQAEALAAMSPADRSIIASALAVQETQKAALIESILKVESNPFEKDFLKAQSVEMLTNLKALGAQSEAVVADDYSGRAAPTAQAQGTPVVQGLEGCVPAPLAFAPTAEAKTA